MADLVRAAGDAFIERNATGSPGSMSKCCWPFRGVVPPHSAAISTNALAADIAAISYNSLPYGEFFLMGSGAREPVQGGLFE